MFGFLTPVRNEATDPLKDVAAARLFWQSLPKDDPIATRKALCEALAECGARVGASVDRLEALLALDQHARALFDALLVNDVVQSAQPSSTANQSWQAALELCRAFGRAYGQFLRLMRDHREFEGRRDCQYLVLLRLLRHRKRELLLRLFSEEAPPFAWREIHEAYRFAQSRELLRDSVPVERNQSASAGSVTLEREYVHVLMQDLLNGGNFSPGSASWVSQRIPRWCAEMLLTPDQGKSGEHRFVVDPGTDAGLVRSNLGSADTALCLDMAPLLKAIRDDVASISDAKDAPGQPWSEGRRRRLRALQKVNALCAAEPPVIIRRGERMRTALTVEVVMGLPLVLRKVRNKPAVAVQPATAAYGEGTTITSFGAPPEDASFPGPDHAATVRAGTTSPWQLTMVDQSDSGCRLHGPVLAANPAVPGALIAFREDTAAPWNLAVVRRVKKRLAGRRIEIGAEYLGTNPKSVIVVVVESDGRSHETAPRVAALYLPESTTHPLLPIKTLILPACGLAPGDRLILRSRTSTHAIRLKEPLEERADFIWSPFEIVDVGAGDDTVSQPSGVPGAAVQ